MAAFTKQQICNLIRKLGYQPHTNKYENGDVCIMVNPGIGEIKPNHREYFLSKGFVFKSDDILGEWIEYKL